MLDDKYQTTYGNLLTENGRLRIWYVLNYEGKYAVLHDFWINLIDVVALQKFR